MTAEDAAQPLRVAIVGAGPAAFYAAEALLRQEQVPVTVDMFERLPVPFGLVRHGVAPDHQKIKNVTRAFAATAADPRFRFYGDTDIGSTVTLLELLANYHQVLFATGAQSDRKMNIPGEDLRRSHPATEFVAWYNGHPDFHEARFDLSQEAVAIIGVGNVAIDVARILCLTPDELRRTDMSDTALAALCQSRIRDVYLIGRRGPAQAAFTTPEVKELGELADTDIVASGAEVELDDLSREELEQKNDRMIARKVELLQSYARRPQGGCSRRLHLRFLVSPIEILDDSTGAVGAIRLAHNRLVRSETGNIVPEPTGEVETIRVGMVFRSVGYRGVPIPGVPFNERWGVIRNEAGRVLDEDNQPVPGLYCAGWIKRGPTGVIGTNKPDAVETVNAMLEDVAERRVELRNLPPPQAIEELIASRQGTPVTFPDWQRLDALELEAGAAAGRPRVKFITRAEMLAALGRA